MEGYKQCLSEEERQQEEGLRHLLKTQNGVHFEAEIAEIKVKKLASGDKGVRIILDTNSAPGRTGKLDNLWELDTNSAPGRTGKLDNLWELDTNSAPGRTGKLDNLWETGETVNVLIYRII